MEVKILELCHVAPPPKSVPPSTLPLTYLDLVWYRLPYPVDYVFLYPFPCPASTFHSSHLPNLKLSLSHALERFYPLAGKLLVPSDVGFPCICYSAGDSVALTIAESDDDPLELSSDQPKAASRFRSLVPSLSDHAVAALQVTLFPNKGIAVGASMLHASTDGSSSIHFMRTWASLCKLSGCKKELLDYSLISEEPPFLDRSVIADPTGLRDAFFSRIRARANNVNRKPIANELPVDDVVRVTLRVSRKTLEKLREWVSGKASTGLRCSSFALATGLVWTCLLKAGQFQGNSACWVAFPVNCRARFDPPLPSSYFGNCLSGCSVKVDESRLVAADGFAVAVEAVMEEIRGLEGGGAIGRLGGEIERSEKIGRERPLTIAGSPRVRVYDVDFGWGRPSKTEVVSIEKGRAMSLLENGGGDSGGLEVGLALPAPLMDGVIKFFNETLETCGC